MRVVRIIDYINEPETIEWLIEGLLPNVGWTLLVGRQGLGKTTFAMQMCSALQGGIDFLGRKVRKTSILYIQADSPPLEWKEILKRVAPKSTGLTIVDVPDKCLDNPAYIGYIQSVIERVKPGFVVYDSFYNLTSVPFSTEKALQPINLMKAASGNLPWMLIHHPPHNESRPAGHHSIEANCSNSWVLMKTKLNINKGRLVKEKEIFLSRDTNGLWVPKDQEYLEDEEFMGKPIF